MFKSKKKYLALGLMSGTSYDGIDAGLIETDGRDYVKLLEGETILYPDEVRDEITRLLNEDYTNIWRVERSISQLHADLAIKFSNKFKLDVIGFHGQTIYHNPQEEITVQLGNPHLIFAATNTNVVNDFRRNDIAFKGQGAPLVPIFLQAINPIKDKAICFLNIGGVTNLCYINKDLIAFDVGPGNAPLDDLCKRINKNYDENGKIASTGKIDNNLLKELLEDDFLNKDYPKSLDRNHFKYDKLSYINIEDALATIVEFIANCIKIAILKLPVKPLKIIVSGGGAYNTFLLNRIKALTLLEVSLVSEYGISIDYLEAYAFGYLAVRSIRNFPLSFPSTTGVSSCQSGGLLIKRR